MPFSITTKDGITINNIPDDIAPDSDVLRQRVADIRAQSQQPVAQQPVQAPTAISPGQQQPAIDSQVQPVLPSPIQQPGQEVIQDVGTGQRVGVGDSDNIPVLGVQQGVGQRGQAVAPQVGGGPQEQELVEQRRIPEVISSLEEPFLTVLSGAVAEPIAGIAGIVQALNPFAEEGAGAEAVEATREALTFIPRTEGGQQNLQAIGETLAPVAETLKAAEQKLGDETLEATGSPALAAAAVTIPTAVLEGLGIASAKGAFKASDKIKRASETAAVKKSIVQSAPQVEQLKDTARAVYNELDESGVTLKPKSFETLVKKTENQLRKQGFDPDLTPKAAAALNRLKSEVGKSPSLSDLDILRKVSQKAAQSIDPADASLGSIMIENIDEFLDQAKPSSFNKGGNVSLEDIGPKYRVARDLWGRARRSELLNESIDKAKLQASGFENGLVTQFRSILGNKKKSRLFKPDELEAMKSVVNGNLVRDMAKLIGRLGLNEGHATSFIGAGAGAIAGAQVLGPVGAVVVPGIGQLSKKLAQRLARKEAAFADEVVRAGPDGKAIASAYLRNTPKAKRSSAELSELLQRPDIALDDLATSSNKVLKDAADIARGRRTLEFAAGIAAPGAVTATQQQAQ